MGRTKWLAIAATAAALCAVLLAIGTWSLQRRVNALELAVKRASTSDPKLVSKAEDTALANEALIKLAGGPVFGDAEPLQRREMLREWCSSKLPVWKDLGPDQRELLLYRLASQLDDLLAERDFEPDKA